MQELSEPAAVFAAYAAWPCPSPRLGVLLRGARDDRSVTRRYVARQIGTTVREVRHCERGDDRAVPSVVAALADCYGEDLVAQVAPRVPVQLDRRRITIGTEHITLQTDDADEMLSAYIGTVARLRHAKPGEPIALRADDLASLSSTLGQAPEDVEVRIVGLLECQRLQTQPAELPLRQMSVPVVGLLTGLAVIAGVGCAGASPEKSPGQAIHPREVAATTTPTSTPTPRIGTSPAPHATTPAVHSSGLGQPGQLPGEVLARETPPTTGVTQIGTALTETATTTPGVKQASGKLHPAITPDTTPMSILPYGPITIIQP